MVTIEDINLALKETTLTKIFFTDLNGRIMNLPINPDNIGSIIANGIGFDGSSVAGYATVDSSDRLLFPDPESFRIVEFGDNKCGFFIGHVYDDQESRARVDPRSVLEDILKKARSVLEDILKKAETEYGFKFLVGPEHEFFLLREDEHGEKVHSDKAGYFQSTPHDKGELVRNRIIAVLKACGIRFEKAHHEVTPSQHEINLECADPLTAADRTILFNYITQMVALELGYHATFMPKPFDDFNRNAFHIHISMQDLDGKNLFYDSDSEDNISSI